MWPALAHRVPAFEALRMRSAWAGYYEVHPLDHNALIGPHPACSNFWLCNGFSGHGLQHAPAAGRGIAERLLTGAWQTLDLSAFSPLRLVDQRAFVEQAIIFDQGNKPTVIGIRVDIADHTSFGFQIAARRGE